VPEETIPRERDCFYPTRRIAGGREVYDFGMELYNDTESDLTVVSMQIEDYSGEEKVADKTYTGHQMDLFNGDRPAKYTMQTGYPLVMFVEEPVQSVTFDSRVITLTVQSAAGEETQRVFRFEVDDVLEAEYPDPDEAEWVPAVEESGNWRFYCEITNDTEQPLTFKGMYSLQYINSNPVRFAYRSAGDRAVAQVSAVEPGETLTWSDSISVQNMFATHRKYVMYYEDPQGTLYEYVFRFVAPKEN
jgi:hypothetical protein